MGERLLCKQEVIGSIPFTSTNKLSARAPRGAVSDRVKQRHCRRVRSGRFVL